MPLKPRSRAAFDPAHEYRELLVLQVADFSAACNNDQKSVTETVVVLEPDSVAIAVGGARNALIANALWIASLQPNVRAATRANAGLSGHYSQGRSDLLLAS